MSNSVYHIGIVPKATLYLSDGSTLDLTNVSIEVEVEQEILQTHQMNFTGRRATHEYVVKENTKLILKDRTHTEVEELTRLIRED